MTGASNIRPVSPEVSREVLNTFRLLQPPGATQYAASRPAALDEIPYAPEHANTPWTEREERRLAALHAEGLNDIELGRRLGRTARAVRLRLGVMDFS